MDPTDIGLFHLAEQRLLWVDQRQRLLAQNVANANTPGYVSRDAAPFAVALGAGLARTAPGHLPGSGGPGLRQELAARSRSPNGNAVSIEDQLSRVADTAGIQELVLGLHHRYQSMFRTALGRAG